MARTPSGGRTKKATRDRTGRRIRAAPPVRSCVSEWFGYRVYPQVSRSPDAVVAQKSRTCPFLSEATGRSARCIKPEAASGICTISSASNGPRQDWLACPYRALDDGLLDTALRRLFSVPDNQELMLTSAASLDQEHVRAEAFRALKSGHRCFIYFQDKLGGEISIAATDRSPELSFDITIVEIERADEAFDLKRYGILEVQTMDFHGSYRAVVKNLEDALRLHDLKFGQEVEQNFHWLSDRIEGPNIANVFKRTLYQILLKFQIGKHRHCAGCVLALPASVWDSWQRLLGRPEATQRPDGTFELTKPGSDLHGQPPAWIVVFDIDPDPRPSPSKLIVKRSIATSAEALAYYAFDVAPSAALAEGASADRVLRRIRERLLLLWPDLAMGTIAESPQD